MSLKEAEPSRKRKEGEVKVIREEEEPHLNRSLSWENMNEKEMVVGEDVEEEVRETMA